jgi:hypothetical protein
MPPVSCTKVAESTRSIAVWRKAKLSRRCTRGRRRAKRTVRMKPRATVVHVTPAKKGSDSALPRAMPPARIIETSKMPRRNSIT